jgi:hypothetical protein
MGKLSTLAMVNETGVMSLTTYGALVVFMKRILLVHPIEILNNVGTIDQFKFIDVDYWQKSFTIDGIEFKVREAMITVPIYNIAAIIEKETK